MTVIDQKIICFAEFSGDTMTEIHMAILNRDSGGIVDWLILLFPPQGKAHFAQTQFFTHVNAYFSLENGLERGTYINFTFMCFMVFIAIKSEF